MCVLNAVFFNRYNELIKCFTGFDKILFAERYDLVSQFYRPTVAIKSYTFLWNEIRLGFF